MTRSKPSRVYHVGDLVRLVDRRRVVKVGYEKDADYYMGYVENSPRVIRFCGEMNLDSRAKMLVCRAVATSIAVTNAKEGTRREVFHEDLRPLRPHDLGVDDGFNYVFEVIYKTVRYAGVYRSSDFIGNDVGGDYYPPYLDRRVALILLCLGIPGQFHPVIKPPVDLHDDGIFVLSTQVEPA